MILPKFLASTIDLVVEAPRHGGFPIKVTSQRTGRRGEFSALWATLPPVSEATSTEQGSQAGEIAVSDHVSETAEVPSSVPGSTGPSNIIRAALGLAFGIMMTSGPLFHDVVANFPPSTLEGPTPLGDENRIRLALTRRRLQTYDGASPASRIPGRARTLERKET